MYRTKIHHFIMLVSIIFAAPIYAQLADSPWPMFHRDTQHTSQCPYSGPENPVLQWTFKAEPGISGSSVIGNDGTIYFGSWDGYLYALDPYGTEKWHFMTQDKITATPAIGIDGTIYVESRDGFLYAIKPDGSLKWKFQFGTDLNNVYTGTLIDEDGTIYVTSDTLYAINPDGTIKWKYEDEIDPDPGVQSSAVLGPDGTIHISRNKHIYAINPDGTTKWRCNMGYYTLNALAVDNEGSVYVGSEKAELFAANSDGTEKWRFQARILYVLSPVIGPDGTIYVTAEDDYLYALEPNGNLKWEFKAGLLIRSSPVIDRNGIIYFNSFDKYLYAIYPDGTLKWKFKTWIGITTSPSLDKDGTLYFGSFDGYLFAVGDKKNVFVDLKINPDRKRFPEGSNMEIFLDAKTYKEDVTGDIYFALLNVSSSELFFGFDWLPEIKAAASSVFMPANTFITDIKLLNSPIPNMKPPIHTQGDYKFAIAVFDPDTGKLLSNLETVDFTMIEN